MTQSTENFDATCLENEAALKGSLESYPSIAIGFSGGVDSAYLCEIAHEVLRDKAEMIIADSPSIPRSELEEAKELAAERRWNLTVINTHEFDNEKYLVNDGTRCYFCRSELFEQMTEFAEKNKVEVLAYGAMADDAFDPTRLGHVAAQEFKVVAPLQLANLHKDEIRFLSKRRNLSTAEKASFACLASRFPTGTRVTLEEIRMVEAAEEVLKGLAFHQYRARHHGDTCRIEVDLSDLQRIVDPETRARVVAGIQEAGYKNVVVDLGGYKMGNAATVPTGLQHNVLDIGTTLG